MTGSKAKFGNGKLYIDGVPYGELSDVQITMDPPYDGPLPSAHAAAYDMAAEALAKQIDNEVVDAIVKGGQKIVGDLVIPHSPITSLKEVQTLVNKDMLIFGHSHLKTTKDKNGDVTGLEYVPAIDWDKVKWDKGGGKSLIVDSAAGITNQAHDDKLMSYKALKRQLKKMHAEKLFVKNEELIKKADKVLGDLAEAGKLTPEQTDKFIKAMLNTPTLLDLVKNKPGKTEYMFEGDIFDQPVYEKAKKYAEAYGMGAEKFVQAVCPPKVSFGNGKATGHKKLSGISESVCFIGGPLSAQSQDGGKIAKVDTHSDKVLVPFYKSGKAGFGQCYYHRTGEILEGLPVFLYEGLM